MSADDVEHALPAGDFSAWLVGMQRALREDGESDVPCAGCTACCTSSQFVRIGPHETDTLAHIPGELQFPAPGSPDGNVVLGYDERGHCPMLRDDGCSIYAHRPKTCRTYDCRVFPAAGVEPDDGDVVGITQVAVGRRARRWRFSYPSEMDRIEHDAVRAAARHLRDGAAASPDGVVPSSPTQLAVMALEAHHAARSAAVEDEREELATHR